jgi:N-acetylneuraminic acid mutarotase
MISKVVIICIVLSIIGSLKIANSQATLETKDSRENMSYWSNAENMSRARNELTAVVLNGKIFAMGGEDIAAGGGQTDTVEVYDIAKNKWASKGVADMPLPLDHTASATYDGKIYVVGGFLKGKVPTDKVFVYEPQSNEWTEARSLPSPIGAALNAEFIDGIMYVVGGLNSSEVPVNTNYAFDPKTNTWSIKSPMPTARHHLATAVIDGKLYAIGGRILGDGVPSEDLSPTLSNFDRVEMYDPKTDSWIVRAPMLTKRSGFTAASAHGMIYVLGGQGLKDVTNSVEKYDPINNKWTYDTQMPTARFGIKAVSFDDRIYVLGGQLFKNSEKVPLDLNQVFHIRTEKSIKQN